MNSSIRRRRHTAAQITPPEEIPTGDLLPAIDSPIPVEAPADDLPVVDSPDPQPIPADDLPVAEKPARTKKSIKQ